MNANAYTHWRLERDGEDIVWLYFDKAGSGTNVLNRDTLDEFSECLKEIISAPTKGLVILSAKAKGFVAGADIEAFTRISDSAEALEYIEYAHTLFNRLEALPFPTVAAIHGFCMGGGTELALACKYRVASDEADTSIGLPEIKLGIHPGFGGTVRAIARAGVMRAMDLMLTGRAISARAARKLGLVEVIAPRRQLKRAARALILERPALKRAPLYARLLALGPIRPLFARLLRKQVAKQACREHYPAPYALIDLWQKHGDKPRVMLREEARSCADLLNTDTARNLIRVFFLRKRLKDFAKPGQETETPFRARHVHVIGAGVMGGDIAIWCALNGIHTTVQDPRGEAMAAVTQRAHALYKKKLKQRRLIQAAMDRLIPDPKAYGLRRADVVIEAIVEDLEAKQALFRDIEARLKPDAILATNTSSLPLQKLGEALSNPARLVGLHFFNPVAKMPLVEVVSHTATEQSMFRRALQFTNAIGRLPLPVISSPGFLVNRILMPYLVEAVILEQEGVPPREIDKAALKFGMPMGPLLLADTVGLDICLSVARILSAELGLQVPERLRTLVESGKLGVKSGSGFYSYKDGKPRYARAATNTGSTTGSAEAARIPDDLSDRLIMSMLNEAVACLREEVVADADLLDAGVVFGTGFAPFRGGPMRYINTTHTADYMAVLNKLEQRHGARFAPDAGWNRLVVQNE